MLLYVILAFRIFTQNLLQPLRLIWLVVFWLLGFNPVSAVISVLHVGCYDWYD